MPSGDTTPALVGYLATARHDMVQVQTLLREAVDRLIEDTCTVREICRSHLAGPVAEAIRVPLVAAIDDRMDASLRHLQFQDMVSQLLDHVSANLVAAESLVFRDPHGGSTAWNMAAVPHPLPDDIAGLRGKPVHSHTMRAGEIELF